MMNPLDEAERGWRLLSRVLPEVLRRYAADLWVSQLVRHFSSSGSTAGYPPVPIAP
jgi:hypothetical protein